MIHMQVFKLSAAPADASVCPGPSRLTPHQLAEVLEVPVRSAQGLAARQPHLLSGKYPAKLREQCAALQQLMGLGAEEVGAGSRHMRSPCAPCVLHAYGVYDAT